MPFMAVTEPLKLPAHFEIEPELREQLSTRPGHQRCIEGAGELLLIAHEVPRPGIPEREALFFWKRHDGTWMQSSGSGLSLLGELMDRYAKVIDGHEEVIDEADTAATGAALATEEDWQLSQFWYSEATSRSLAGLVQSLARRAVATAGAQPRAAVVACLSCPSVFKALRALLDEEAKREMSSSASVLSLSSSAGGGGGGGGIAVGVPS